MAETVEQRFVRLVQRLRAGGGRVTPQRLAILRAVAEDPSHPSVEDVYRKVRVQFPCTSLATVYKTLAILEEIGEVVEVASVNEVSRYDGLNPYPHPHLICSQCGCIMDLPVDDVTGLVRSLAGCAPPWRLTERVEIWGLCPKCQQGA